MSRFNDVKYDSLRSAFQKYIERKSKEGEEPDYLLGNSKSELGIQINSYNNLFDLDLDEESWILLFEEEKEAFYNTKPFEVISDSYMSEGAILSPRQENNLSPRNDRDSNWSLFKNKVLKKKNKFPDLVISNIEKDTERILKQMSIRTNEKDAIKGLAIGNVQSGKTTNMSALMAMSSDHGFNLFIILAGSIENLRVQTEERLYSDFNGLGRRYQWEMLNSNPRENKPLSQIYADNKRFYMVVLKQKNRLKDLNNWLALDENILDKINLVVIDDEADYASVNTSDNPEEERKTINKKIIQLVGAKNTEKSYNSVNYIGYTATPYANILSERPGEDSLYPKDFITILSKSPNYFGSKEIFGQMGTDIDGLNIIRNIDDDHILKDVNEGNTYDLPNSLKESIAYFITASASLRKHNFGKPVTMLVHTSNIIKAHEYMANNIKLWLKNKEEVYNLCEKIWTKELSEISVEDFARNNVLVDSNYYKRHKFYEIEDEVKNILNEVSPVIYNADRNKNIYHDGIHLQIDNSSKNLTSYDEYNYRLSYPELEEDNNRTPIFLVVGGNTLSRGITLKGLITTYFARTTQMTDTLTQMGRWFGYRPKYELYPRVWLNPLVKERFRYVSSLEEELRKEIYDMNITGVRFDEVGPKIKNSPKYLQLKLTSPQKSQFARDTRIDFRGSNIQTYIFDRNEEIQERNIILAENFINSLGKPIIKNEANSSRVYWENIDFNTIRDGLLKDFIFSKRTKSFNQIDLLIKWFEEMTENKKINNWNVIIGGKGKANEKNNDWVLKHFTYNKVNRTEKINTISNDIEIGVLRAPKDIYADMDIDLLKSEKMRENFEKYSTKHFPYIRKKLNLHKTPQLIIYRIDKNSEPGLNNKNRKKLGINTDIIGIYIYVPMGDSNEDYSSYVTVDILEKEELMDGEY